MADSKTASANSKEQCGLLTDEVLDEWLRFETLTLWHAALLANDACPQAMGLGLSPAHEGEVVDTYNLLRRSGKLRPTGTEDDTNLYNARGLFKDLDRQGFSFRPKIKQALLKRGIIGGIKRIRGDAHGNILRYETQRSEVYAAIIRVLADPNLHSQCCKDGTADSEVVGVHVARTVIANEQQLFENGKCPVKQETIAKYFNEIRPLRAS
jgi:hypothetical protein